MVAKKWFLAIVFILVGQWLSAQCILQLSGVVTDADTREKLGMATIVVVETGKTVQTNSEGRFIIEGLCPGNYNLRITHVGCEPMEIHVHINSDLVKNIQLPHRHNELSEVIVTGSGKQKSTASVSELKGAALEATRGQSLGEALQRIPGVNVLQTGNNLYKPVINGLHSNRVLILNNGIRQEGQQWGSEHAPEIDPYVANRLSVIKGAGMLRYGGDAIGGVVLVEPRLLPNVPGIAGEINLAGFSNNRQAVASGIIEGNSAKHRPFSWRLQGTYKRGGNAKTPDYWMANSGSREYNFSVNAGWNLQHKGVEVFYSQFNNEIGIFSGAHVGNRTDLINAIKRGEPDSATKAADFSYTIGRPYQTVQHHLMKVKAFRNTGDIGRLNWITAAQYNRREEYDKVRTGLGSKPQLQLDLYTLTSELVWDHYSWHGLRGTIGVNAGYQYNSYVYRYFIPNYEALNFGAFWTEKIDLNKFLLEGGIRFDYRSIYAITNNNDSVFPGKNYPSVSGNIGVTYTMAEGMKVTLSGSSPLRSPQVNELYSSGLHHGAARIEKGLPTMQPERAYSAMLNFNVQRSSFNVDLLLFHKDIRGFMFLKPVYPLVSTIRGAFPAFDHAQTDARLTGADLTATWNYDKHLSFTAKGSVLRAIDKRTDDWLIQMPADRFEGEITYQFSDGKFWKETYLKANVQRVLKQSRVPGTGNIEVEKPDGSIALESDYAPPPSGYTLAGLEAGTHIRLGSQPIHLILGVQNVFDTRYRDYMNAFRYFTDDKGRDISIRIKLPIDSRK